MKNYAYLASPFFNTKQLDFIERIENELDGAGIKYFSPRSEGVLIDMTEEERKAKMIDIFQSNIRHMREASFMVANIDDFDTGTMFEIGFFYALGKPVFTITDNDFGLNIMIRQASTRHNTDLDHLITNILQLIDGRDLTIFDELTDNVT